MKISLEKTGLSVTFTDPSKALKEFNTHYHDYDPVISDIRMPHMNGYEFVLEVKKIEPDMKILLMSAFRYNNSDIPNGFSASNVEEFIEKPVSLHKLNEIVHKYSSTSTK